MKLLKIGKISFDWWTSPKCFQLIYMFLFSPKLIEAFLICPDLVEAAGPYPNGPILLKCF